MNSCRLLSVAATLPCPVYVFDSAGFCGTGTLVCAEASLLRKQAQARVPVPHGTAQSWPDEPRLKQRWVCSFISFAKMAVGALVCALSLATNAQQPMPTPTPAPGPML